MHKVAAAIVLLWIVPAFGETKKLWVTADVGICAHPKETHINTGLRRIVRVKGNEHYYLFRFDAKPIRAWAITKASLHLKLAGGRLRRVAVCTVPRAWVEGTATWRAQAGSTCFAHLKYPDVPWTPGGGTLLDATFNCPRMMWRASEVRIDGRWMEIPLAPQLVQAVAVGLAHGLVLGEETGQTRENHDVYTAEQANARPYLVVEGTPHHVAASFAVHRPAPKVEAFAAATGFGSAAVRIDPRWPNPPGRILGSRVRVGQKDFTVFGEEPLLVDGLRPSTELPAEVVTFIGAQGYAFPRQRGTWKISTPAALAAPRPVKLAPAGQGKRLHVGTGGWRVELVSASAKRLPNAGPAAGGATMALPVTARNAWLGLQAVLHPPGGKAEELTLAVSPPRYVGAQLELVPPLEHVQLYRAWYVPHGKAHQPEVLVPIRQGQRLDIPWKKNNVPGQVNQQVYVDVWVPKSAVPGPYEAKLQVLQGGKAAVTAPIRFQVAAATLPDEFHVVGDMNTYGPPGRQLGVGRQNVAAYLAAERTYYRLAHAHRMTLNPLPYTQSGKIGWRGAPKLAGRGAQCTVADFAAWDAHYGPLLSGEAFTAKHGYVGPGEGTPIRHMYLPFHENWPSRLAEHFRPWPPPKDYPKFLLWSAALRPIGECLDEDFTAAWRAVLRQFQHHLRKKGWTRTRYQVYLNNKYYFRDRRRHSGRGISLWLLDEPMFADDFLALAYFGRLTKHAAAPAGESLVDYRIDISRPTHQRNWLDGLVDLNVCADQLYSQRRLIAHRRRAFGEEYWNYNMPRSFGASNLGWATWAIRSTCWGAAGTLPWQTVGGDGALDRATDTALMLPGNRFGLAEPLPSLRMKAWRDGIQDAELLGMLGRKNTWRDVQLRAWVGGVCGLAGWRDGVDPKPDAPIVTFAGLTDEKLQRLRRATIAKLLEE